LEQYRSGIVESYQALLSQKKLITAELVKEKFTGEDQREHLHIIYNRVDRKGKTIPDNLQHQRSGKACKELTLKHYISIT